MSTRGPHTTLLAGLVAMGTLVVTGNPMDASPSAVLGDPAVFEQAADTLAVGERAPDFVIPSTVSIPEGTGTVRLSAITASGKSVVLAFFPKAFTGG